MGKWRSAFGTNFNESDVEAAQVGLHKDITAKLSSVALNKIEFSATGYTSKPWPSCVVNVPYILCAIVEIAAISKVNLPL